MSDEPTTQIYPNLVNSSQISAHCFTFTASGSSTMRHEYDERLKELQDIVNHQADMESLWLDERSENERR